MWRPTVLDVMGIKALGNDRGIPFSGYEFGQDRRILPIILDGWGLGTRRKRRHFLPGDTPFWDALVSGKSWSRASRLRPIRGAGERASRATPEAGHINLGAGRLVLQDDASAWTRR